jgi:hypothetical protein
MGMRLHQFRKKAFLVWAVWLFLFGAGAGVCSADNYQAIRSHVNESFSKDGNAVLESVQRAENSGVNPDSVSLILSRSKETQLPATDLVKVIDRVSEAKRDGLPTRPFTEKILEGLAKNVPPPAIVNVLDKKLDTYRESKKIVGEATRQPGTDANAVTSVALAMERGVSPRGMQQLYSAEAHDPATVSHSAQALADLESMGFTEDEGVKIVGAGLKAGYLRTSSSSITQIAARAKKLGRSNNDIAHAMETGFNRGMPLSEISVELHGGGPGGKYGGGMRRGRGGQGYGGSEGPGSHGKGSGRGKH